METPMPSRGKGAKASDSPTDPSGEENFPRDSPMRKSVDKRMQEPSNVRPSNDPTPEKTPPTQGVDSEVQGE